MVHVLWNWRNIDHAKPEGAVGELAVLDLNVGFGFEIAEVMDGVLLGLDRALRNYEVVFLDINERLIVVEKVSHIDIFQFQGWNLIIRINFSDVGGIGKLLLR